MRFLVEIELGNAGMSEPEDVAIAVERVASKLRSCDIILTERGDGPIKDVNGNNVGEWRVRR